MEEGPAIRADLHRDLLFAAVAASRAPTLLVGAAGADFPILELSPALAELVGWPAELLRGRDVLDLEVLEPDAATIAGLGAARDSGAAAELEVGLVRPDGNRMRAALSARPLQDSAGRVHYLLCSLAAGSAADSAGAESAERRPTDVVAEARRVRHEFNNLLTVIRGTLGPLREVAADPLAARRLERLAAAVDGLTDLVGGFLGALRRTGETAASDLTQQRMLPQARAAERILLIEPDATFRAQGSAMLRGLGYQIEEVADADSALRWLSSAESVDLILADRQVQCADGLPLVERIREIRRGLRVLFSAESQLLQGGGAIAKPFQLLALASAVRGAIDGYDPAG